MIYFTKFSSYEIFFRFFHLFKQTVGGPLRHNQVESRIFQKFSHKISLEKFFLNFRNQWRIFSEFLEFILRLTWFQLDCPQLDSRLRDTIYSYFCLCLVTNLFFTVLFMPFNNVPFNVLFYLTCLIIFFGHFRGHLRSLRSNPVVISKSF